MVTEADEGHRQTSQIVASLNRHYEHLRLLLFWCLAGHGVASQKKVEPVPEQGSPGQNWPH